MDMRLDTEALLGGLMHQSVTPVAEVDVAGGRILRVNEAFAAMLGTGDAPPGAGRQRRLEHQLFALAGGAADTDDMVDLARPDGGEARARVARLALARGRALLLFAPAAPIPAPGQHDYRDIYENIGEGIYRSSPQGRPLSANPALARLNGYETEAELLAAISDNPSEWYVDPGRRAEFAELLRQHGRVTDFVSEVYRHRTRERIWVSENARLVRDWRGEALHYEATVRDVTETVRRLQLEERLRTIVDTIADAVIAADAAGAIQQVNRAAEAMFGWRAGELVGRRLGELLDGEGPGGEGLARGRRRDGSTFPADVATAEAADLAGALRIHCVRDATARVRYEQGLREAKDAAERANRAKSDFLAIMSHELRTPLNAVIGMAGLLLDGMLDETSRRHAETLRDGADHLLQLISDVLDFSKLDAGRFDFEDIPFELDALVHGVLDLLAPRAHAKGLEMGAYIAPGVPPHLSGDPGRIRQVLMNLLGNAVKFTERGTVTLEAERVAPQPGLPPGMVELAVEVRDTGIGMSPEQLPLLFKEFSQLDSSISRRFGGTGLGLAICHRLVTGMGGKIAASSRPGQGSVFRFTLRLRELAEVPARPPAERERLDGERILVVDDNAVNRSIFTRQLEARGARVLAVADGAAALDALHDGAAQGAAFDGAVIDHVMPGTDGELLARAIRGDATLPPLRLVLATSAAPRDLGGLDAGPVFDTVLNKPVPVDTLVRALRGMGAPPAPPRPSPSDLPARGAPSAAVRVLVAEDNATNQVVIRAMIDRLGHAATIVGDGRQAVDLLGRERFDVVLMDVMMPEMDGIEATRRIRAMPGPSGRVPIFGLTAHIGPEEHAGFRAAGMDSVITKPVTAKALAAALAPLVGQGAA